LYGSVEFGKIPYWSKYTNQTQSYLNL
jgi:hypothetical protein